MNKHSKIHNKIYLIIGFLKNHEQHVLIILDICLMRLCKLKVITKQVKSQVSELLRPSADAEKSALQSGMGLIAGLFYY